MINIMKNVVNKHYGYRTKAAASSTEIHLIPYGCPPATMWSQKPGYVCLVLLLFATHRDISFVLLSRTYPFT